MNTKGVNFQPSKWGQFSAAVDTPAVGSEFLKALTRELRYQFERIQAQCCEFGSRTGRCV